MQYSDFIVQSDAYFVSPHKRESEAISLLRASNRMLTLDTAEQRDLAKRRTWISFYMYEASRGRVHVPQFNDELDDF